MLSFCCEALQFSLHVCRAAAFDLSRFRVWVNVSRGVNAILSWKVPFALKAAGLLVALSWLQRWWHFRRLERFARTFAPRHDQ